MRWQTKHIHYSGCGSFYLRHRDFLLGLFLSPEDGSGMFFREMG
jgi:hypothetical protein